MTTFLCEPGWTNINLDCGALHLESCGPGSCAAKADAGVAFDGDADRAMMVAPSGRVIDGDAILLIAARRMQADGHLPGNLVVSTVMANLGLEKALGGSASRCSGHRRDKYVLEEMMRRDAALGGEQSGHIIFRDTQPRAMACFRIADSRYRRARTTRRWMSWPPTSPSIPRLWSIFG